MPAISFRPQGRVPLHLAIARVKRDEAVTRDSDFADLTNQNTLTGLGCGDRARSVDFGGFFGSNLQLQLANFSILDVCFSNPAFGVVAVAGDVNASRRCDDAVEVAFALDRLIAHRNRAESFSSLAFHLRLRGWLIANRENANQLVTVFAASTTDNQSVLVEEWTDPMVRWRT